MRVGFGRISAFPPNLDLTRQDSTALHQTQVVRQTLYRKVLHGSVYSVDNTWVIQQNTWHLAPTPFPNQLVAQLHFISIISLFPNTRRLRGQGPWTPSTRQARLRSGGFGQNTRRGLRYLTIFTDIWQSDWLLPFDICFVLQNTPVYKKWSRYQYLPYKSWNLWIDPCTGCIFQTRYQGF